MSMLTKMVVLGRIIYHTISFACDSGNKNIESTLHVVNYLPSIHSSKVPKILSNLLTHRAMYEK